MAQPQSLESLWGLPAPRSHRYRQPPPRLLCGHKKLPLGLAHLLDTGPIVCLSQPPDTLFEEQLLSTVRHWWRWAWWCPFLTRAGWALTAALQCKRITPPKCVLGNIELGEGRGGSQSHIIRLCRWNPNLSVHNHSFPPLRAHWSYHSSLNRAPHPARSTLEVMFAGSNLRCGTKNLWSSHSKGGHYQTCQACSWAEHDLPPGTGWPRLEGLGQATRAKMFVKVVASKVGQTAWVAIPGQPAPQIIEKNTSDHGSGGPGSPGSRPGVGRKSSIPILSL